MRPPVGARPRPRPAKRNACATTSGHDPVIVTSDCRSTRLRRHLASSSLCTNVMVCTRSAAQFVIGDAHFVGVELVCRDGTIRACATGARDQYGRIREVTNARFRKRACGIAGRRAVRQRPIGRDRRFETVGHSLCSRAHSPQGCRVLQRLASSRQIVMDCQTAEWPGLLLEFRLITAAQVIRIVITGLAARE